MEELLNDILFQLKNIGETDKKILEVLMFQNSTRKVSLNINNKKD